MDSIKRHIKENVYCRCGQAVSRLAEREMIPRPELPTSESEIHEWWLVSAALARKLRAARMPVLTFAELNLWGRMSTGVALEDDVQLLAAIGSTAPKGKRRGSRPKTQRKQAGKKKRAARGVS